MKPYWIALLPIAIIIYIMIQVWLCTWLEDHFGFGVALLSIGIVLSSTLLVIIWLQ